MNQGDESRDDRNAGRNGPLRDRTILTTRARAQSAGMTELLESLGATVIHCPTIEVLPPDSWAELDASIDRIRDYNCIVFTSANGVRYFFQRLSERQIDAGNVIAGCIVCAIGPATARA